MLTRRIKTQVIAFVVVALAATTFVGASYAGLGRLLGRDGLSVHLQLADGGGLFPGSEVTYLGVAVGEVDRLHLTDDGMEAVLVLDEDAPAIPADSHAVVANRSAVGEQYVDLRSPTGRAPYLEDGSVIRRESTTLPLPVHILLSNLNAFTESVPTESLRTVVDELYTAFQGTGDDLQVLLDSSREFTHTATEYLPQTTTLIEDGATVLRTQAESAEAWRSFADNTKLFARELAGADGDLRELIARTPGAATQLSGLLSDTDPGLSVLIANLVTTSRLFSDRVDGLEHLFVMLPKATAATSAALDGDQFSVALTFFDPPPCLRGYEGTPRRAGEDGSDAPFNTDAACTVPHGDPRAVRGSQHVPEGGLPPVVPPGVSTGDDNTRTSLRDLLWLDE